jgi:phage FluMu gp28-like protein
MKDLLDYFLPYQRRWITADAAIVVGEKSRRIGWTYASSFRAVKRRIQLGTDLFYSSADLSAAREFMNDCQQWARVFKVAAKPGEQTIDEADGMRAFVLRFENGSKIVAGSSNPKFFRSKGGDADADEFAFHREPRELYKAMQPAALVWGHQMRLWSTHNGEGSFFNQLVKSAPRGSGVGVEGSGEGRLAVHRVTLIDAVEQGLVEKIRKLDAPDLVARRDFLEEVRASCPDEDAWNEEYLCRPSSEQSSLLSYALIQACEAESGGVVEWRGGGVAADGGLYPATPPHNPSNPSALYAGFDVGRKHDRSVLWLVERVGDVLWTRGLRVLHDVNFTAQEQLLVSLMDDRTVRRLCIDSTGIGAMLAERLVQRFGHRVEAVHFTAAVKSDLAMPLLRLFQDRLVRVPADADVREDLHKVRKVVTASNNVRLEADRDERTGHADRFWALALACHAAQEAKDLPAPLARKPIEW